MTDNVPVDFTDAVLGETTIKVTEGSPVVFSIVVSYEAQHDNIRVTMTDIKTGNDANRTVSNGMVSVGTSARIPIKPIYDLLPEMTEEIVVLNRMFGHVTYKAEEEEV